MAETIGADLREWRKLYRLKQAEVAERIGVSRGAYANWESDMAVPTSDNLKKLRAMGFQSDVGPPMIPAPIGMVPVPYVGFVSASNPADWRDPDLCEDFKDVPGAWDTRGCFTCHVDTDSMYPLIYPGDLLMFKRDPVPRIGFAIMFRSQSGTVTIKQLKHNGTGYVLHPLNSAYSDCPAEGECIGYLLGIIRQEGRRTMTIYEETGIVP